MLEIKTEIACLCYHNCKHTQIAQIMITQISAIRITKTDGKKFYRKV